MSVRLVNVNEQAGPSGPPLRIVESNQTVAFGEEVEVDDPELAERLIVSGLFARPTTKAAKAAVKEGS